LDSRRKRKLDLDTWIKLLLLHSSRRFQSHSHFVGLAYDVVRRRNGGRGVGKHTRSKGWEKTQEVLDCLTPAELEHAAALSRDNGRVDDPRILKLLSSISRTSTTLDESDDKKSHLLVELKSSVVYYGLPLIFVTLNPADNYSPLALFFAGEKIDLANFDPDLYPYKDRVDTLLNNPIAVLLYFHHTIQAILGGPLRNGLFGPLLHYYGTIEY
jgi:Helitron helicase-like domain at N-terminus